mgnify:FL=1
MFFYRTLTTSISRINTSIKIDVPLIRDVLIIETGKKICICRCWKSNRFPECDGSHIAHNKKHNDNVGPIIIATPNIVS